MTTLQILRAGVNKLPRKTSREKREIQKRITKAKNLPSYFNIEEDSDITPARACVRLILWVEDDINFWRQLSRDLQEVTLSMEVEL